MQLHVVMPHPFRAEFRPGDFTASFAAVVLVWPPSACNESDAVDVIAINVDSELGCSRGWHEAIARGDLKEGIGTTLYVKSMCRRLVASSMPMSQQALHATGRCLGRRSKK